jgi:hypothetical protein
VAEDLITWTIQLAISKDKTEIALRNGKLEEIFAELRKIMTELVGRANVQIEGELRAAIDIMARYPGFGLVEAIKLVNGGQGSPTVN